MEWITTNWILLLVAALCIGMHFFGGGHGTHGKHGEKESDELNGHTHADSSDESKNKNKGHGCCH